MNIFEAIDKFIKEMPPWWVKEDAVIEAWIAAIKWAYDYDGHNSHHSTQPPNEHRHSQEDNSDNKST